MRAYLSVVAMLLSWSLMCCSQTAAGRYLYVVGCGAVVDKLDTAKDQKIDSYDLATRTGKERLVPQVKGTLDGCLAYQAAYDAAASVFYTVVPIESESKPDGTKDYRVLVFSVPQVELVRSINGVENVGDPPHLEIGAGESVKIVNASGWAPRTTLDLSTFAPDLKAIPNQILEASGEKVLLRIFAANPNELIIAVADRKSKTLVRLQSVPSTLAPDVHLVPGGADVLVEEIGRNAGRATKTGKLMLYDSETGRAVKDFSDPHVKELYFLALSPTGKAIYHSGNTYWFIDLGQRFVPVPVTRPISTGYPGLFFAEK